MQQKSDTDTLERTHSKEKTAYKKKTNFKDQAKKPFKKGPKGPPDLSFVAYKNKKKS